MFRRGGSAYDFVAELISHSRKLNPGFFFNPASRESVKEEEDWTKAVDELLTKYPELADTRELCTFGIGPKTVNAIRSWKHYGDFFYVLTLLQRITRTMKWETIVDSSYVAVKNREGFEALNDNAEETGVYLFPRVSSLPIDGRAKSTPKQWLSRFSCGINQELSNICYFLKEDLVIEGQQYKVCHHIYQNFFMEGSTKLTIASSPLLCDAELDLSCITSLRAGENQRIFSVKGIKNLNRVLRRSRATFLEACRTGADILLFPEMLGNARLFFPGLDFSKTISVWIEAAEAEGYPVPRLIVGPTWWHDQRNELYVLSNTGQRLFVQNKQFSFSYTPKGESKPYLEDLCISAPTIHVLHIPGLGRMVFPICVDFLHPKYTEFLVQKLYANMLLCPSYSPSKTLFSLSSASYLPYGSWVFWINSCSAPCANGKGLPEYVGTVSSVREDGAFETQYLCVPSECCCGKDDECCLFLQDIDLQTGEAHITEHFPPH